MKLPAGVQPWQIAAGIGVGLGLLLWSTRTSSKAGLTFRSTAEGFAPLEPESGCDLRIKPGVAAFRQFVMANFGGYDAGILRECKDGVLSGHQLGRAWDWGVDNPNARTDVQGFLNFLFANNAEILRRAGITYVIYNRRIWNTRDRVWQNYTGEDDHTSHVHISFGTPGANGTTSFYRDAVA